MSDDNHPDRSVIDVSAANAPGPTALSTAKRGSRTARIYHDGSLQPGVDLPLDKQASHHLLTVLRTKLQANVIVFNGDGHEYQATLVSGGTRGSDKRAVLAINACNAGIPEPGLLITLVQCVSKPERMDISLRQAVELGVTCIQPVFSRHSIKAGDATRAAKKQQHWQSIIISASEQSGRAVVPQLGSAMSYALWVQQHSLSSSPHYVLSPDAPQSLIQQAHTTSTADRITSVALIIGPESGLDSDEVDSAVAAGALPVNIGHRILRTETAGPACIVLLQSILGDLQA